MPRYEMDEYVQGYLADDAVNVNCVASWRGRADAAGHLESLYIDFHNSWYFDSRCWDGRTDAPARLLTMLQRNERGSCGSQRVAWQA
jgi:hypothetical protein